MVVATVPSGTPVAGLVATFSTTGASVSVGGTAQMTGVTANDFINICTVITNINGTVRYPLDVIRSVF